MTSSPTPHTKAPEGAGYAAVSPSHDAAEEGAGIAFGSLGKFNADFNRIFGKWGESGTQAAADGPALINASDPTRNGNTSEGEIDHV